MKIQTLDSASVQTGTLGTPQRSTSDPVAQSLEGAGKAMQGVGGQLSQYAGEMKYKADTAVHDKAVSDLLSVDNTLKSGQGVGFLARKGSDAVGITDEYLGEYDKAHSTIRDGLKNDQQKAMFDHTTGRYRSSLETELMRHAAEQGQTAAIDGKNAIGEQLDSRAMSQYTNMEPGGEFWKTLDDVKKNALQKSELLHGRNDVVNLQDVNDATGKALAQAIEQLSISDVTKASQILHDNADKFGNPSLYLKLEKELEPKLKAKRVDNFVQQAVASAKDHSDPDAPMDEEKAIESLRKQTDDPEELKLGREKINQIRSDHDKSIKDRFDYYGGTLVDKWESNPSLTVADIMKEPEYGKLDAPAQGKLKAKIRQSIEHRDSVERSTRAAEKSASAAARSAATAAAAELRVASENSAFKLMADPERLSNLSDGAYKVERAGLRPQEQIKLDEVRKQVKDPKHLKDATAHKDMVDATLGEIPGMKPDEQKVLSGRILSKLGELQKDKGGRLTDDETRDAVIKFARFQWIEEKHLFGDKQVPKRGISVTKEDKPAPRPKEVQDRLDLVAKKRGRAKLSPAEETALEQAILEQEWAKGNSK